MKHAVIANPRIYEDYHELIKRPFQFLLGHEMLESDSYLSTARQMRQYGCFIMIDNGAAELGSATLDDFPDIVQAALNIDADEIVLPDALRDAQKTIEMTTEQAHLVPPKRRVVVPQGTNWAEWIDCFLELHKQVQFVTVGIPKHAEAWEGGRIAGLKLLKHLGYDTIYNIHLLGTYGQPIQEIYQLSQAYGPLIRSFDTGASCSYTQAGVNMFHQERKSLDWHKRIDNTILFQSNIRMLDNVGNAL